MENEERMPTTFDILNALRCGGYSNSDKCDECYYGCMRACYRCQRIAALDAADMIEKMVEVVQ